MEEKFEDCILKAQVTFVVKFPELKEEAIELIKHGGLRAEIYVDDYGVTILDLINDGDVTLLRGSVKFL